MIRALAEQAIRENRDVTDQTWPNPKYEPKYVTPASHDVLDALRLPLLFHGAGPWDDAKRLAWLRITGTEEATTKVMCDHLRMVLGIVEGHRDGR